MESTNLLSGKNTRKVEPESGANRSATRKTVLFVLLIVAVAGVAGYALTMTPLAPINDTNETRGGIDPPGKGTQDSATDSTVETEATVKKAGSISDATNEDKSTKKSAESDRPSTPLVDSCSPREPTVLIYNRVPKAGSSSMTSLINKLSSRHKFKMLGWFDLPSHDFEAVQASVHDALAKGEKTVIAQHFHFPEIVHEDVAYINVLREPVSRCTSQYYYLRYGDRREKDRKKVLDKYGDLTIDECIDSGNHEKCFNCDGWKQSMFFCGPDGGECGGFSPDEVLQQAKSVIDTHYVVGVIEDFEGTVAVMEKMFPTFFEGGLELLKKVKPQRVTQGSKEYVPPSNASVAEIKKILAQDEQLYSYVKDKLEGYKKCLKA
jgi:hypothetical protein